MRVAPKRIVAAALGLTSVLTYVWFAAVRATPGIRRRKAARRLRHRA